MTSSQNLMYGYHGNQPWKRTTRGTKRLNNPPQFGVVHFFQQVAYLDVNLYYSDPWAVRLRNTLAEQSQVVLNRRTWSLLLLSGKSRRFTSAQFMQQTGRQVPPRTLKSCHIVLLGGLRASSLRYNGFPVFGRSVRNRCVGGIRDNLEQMNGHMTPISVNPQKTLIIYQTSFEICHQ